MTKKRITYMAFLGMLIALTVSCAENSTSAITKVNNSGISETTQSEQQSTSQSDTDAVGNTTTSKEEELVGNEKEILTDTFQDFIPYNPNFVNCLIDKTLEQAGMPLTDLLNTIENDEEKISVYWQTYGPNCLSFLTEEEFKLLNSPLTDSSGNSLIQEAEEPGRIQFSADDIGTRLRGTFMEGDGSPNYIFTANAGQLLELELRSENPNANIALYGPNPLNITSFRSTKILVPDNGDYLFFINKLETNNDYLVDILITDPIVQRIQFNAGESSSILSGGIVRGESGPVYLFQADAQQLLNATITTLEENGSMDIVTPSGRIIAQDQKDIELTLSETGDYLMQVNPIRGNVSFEVVFEILSVPTN
tara:strand:- start:1291 stop:2385 length:1095 start_codon:yes stop_codon:yes gene_type:complete